MRPSWHASLPSNFGSPEHGKLKADQWRSCFEFDLPVSLVQLCVRERGNRTDEENSRAWDIAQNTINLSLAADWGTSDVTSEGHADKYDHYIKQYVSGLRRLYPSADLHPNHHLALHFSQMLLDYGPAMGTWAFPFERLVGKLQKLNTNSRTGT